MSRVTKRGSEHPEGNVARNAEPFSENGEKWRLQAERKEGASVKGKLADNDISHHRTQTGTGTTSGGEGQKKKRGFQS